MTFAVEQRPYVQVLHDSTLKHWLTISNIGAEDPASVLVYDSLFHQCSPHAQQVAAISKTKSSQINAHFVDCNVKVEAATVDSLQLCFGTHPEKSLIVRQ